MNHSSGHNGELILMNLFIYLFIYLSFLSQHGRLKVRSTAEQEEARRREKERKVLWYREKNEAIFAKVMKPVAITVLLLIVL